MLTSPSPARPNASETDPRPRFGIGHLSIAAADVRSLTEFYVTIGMRPVMTTDDFSILELRGGTHLILQTGEPGVATLDLIVDDIDETRGLLGSAGADPGPITRGNPHDRFLATDPEGNRLVVASNHAIGPV
ncbi:MAG: VOC family protein [Actinomycetota bacterium]